VTRTTCPYCGVGCGIIAERDEAGAIAIKGDPEHPANFGRLCSKGSALAETLSLDGRLLYPEIRGERASWDAALDLTAAKFSEAIARRGPDSVAFYISGQFLTEDYYVANKLMKGFIGSANIDTNSRLCMASSVAGHSRAFGADLVPGNYEDLECADLVVLVGSNLAWCHPVLFQRLVAAKEKRGTKIVVIDPRKTATAEFADLHLAIRPGSDVALFNGLLLHLHQRGKTAPRFVFKHTLGLAGALIAAQDCDPARETGLAEEALRDFYQLFARHDRSVTLWSQGVNQSSAGTDKVNAIINCHLIAGRIGKPGATPFSVTGQPNAMGGREVGGMANMLAAHMNIEDPAHRDRVRRFWQSPRIAQKPGLKAVDMFEAVRDGRIKAIWIMATNPVVSIPDADAVRAALEACPFVAVSDAVRETDTTRHAHVLLPAAAWGEKEGTVTNSERRVSRQRAFLAVPGEARADWKIICDVGKRMGFHGFGFEDADAVFREHAALTSFENDGERPLEIGADTNTPFQWGGPRLFADGRFATFSGRANFVATPHRPPASVTTQSFPLILNTGRIRDQWHTMTRTGKSVRLMVQMGEPFLETHPDDAAAAGFAPASLARVSSSLGETILRVLVTDRQQRGSVFAPMHWNTTHASLARIDALIPPNTDPVSGQPELKFASVRIAPFAARWHAFAVTTKRPAVLDSDYWAIAKTQAGYRIELAGTEVPESWTGFASQLIGAQEYVAYADNVGLNHRFVAFEGDRLCGAVFIARDPVPVARDWLVEQLGQSFPPSSRLRLLAGIAGTGAAGSGPVVCVCNNVGKSSIVTAILSGATTIEAVGRATSAGTSCGSCRAEILAMVGGRCLQAAERWPERPTPHAQFDLRYTDGIQQ
jgi:assimilatory nitrate reductase catalytic subunit